MNRTQKAEFVTDLQKGLADSQAFALLSFSKLTVDQMTQFRLALRKQDIRVRVVKNTLAKRALANGPFADASAHLEGPTLVAYGADPVLTAKAVAEWAGKENFSLKIKGGAALGQLMTSQQLTALSKLPGRNELLVSFLWALKSAPTKVLYALQDKPRSLGYALAALKEKKEKAG